MPYLFLLRMENEQCMLTLIKDIEWYTVNVFKKYVISPSMQTVCPIFHFYKLVIGTCFCIQFYHMVIPGADSGGGAPAWTPFEKSKREKEREGDSSRAGCRSCWNSSSNGFFFYYFWQSLVFLRYKHVKYTIQFLFNTGILSLTNTVRTF